MTSKLLQDIPQAIQDALTNWSQQQDADLPKYLETLVSPQEAETILNVLDRITAATTELKNSGLPPRVWAGEKLEKLAPQLLDDGPLGDLRGMEPVELGSHIIDLGLAGQTGFADETVEEVISTFVDTNTENELDIATQFFQSPLGDKKERTVTAVATAGTLNLANSLGEKSDAATFTTTIDLGLHAAKIAFKEAAGELDADQAFQALEDRIAAGAVAFVEQAVDQLPDAGALVGSYLGALVGNPIGGATAGRSLAEMVAPSIKPIVRKATQNLARKAVKIVKKEAVKVFTTIRAKIFG